MFYDRIYQAHREIIDQYLIDKREMIKQIMTKEWQLESSINREYSGVSLQDVIQEVTGHGVEKEKFVDATFVDLYQELPKEKFVEVFGQEALNPKSRDEESQKVVYEIEGPIHNCACSGELNLKTTSKLSMLRNMGLNPTYIRSSELVQASNLSAEERIKFLQELMAKRMNSE